MFQRKTHRNASCSTAPKIAPHTKLSFYKGLYPCPVSSRLVQDTHFVATKYKGARLRPHILIFDELGKPETAPLRLDIAFRVGE